MHRQEVTATSRVPDLKNAELNIYLDRPFISGPIHYLLADSGLFSCVSACERVKA
jgi:hypothetical protein